MCPSRSTIPLLALAILTLVVSLPASYGRNPPVSAPLIVGKTDAATLLPDVSAEKILDQWQNARYGVVIGANGELLLAYSPGGESLFKLQSWYLQGHTTGADGKLSFHYLGSAEHINASVDVSATREGYRLYELKDSESDYVRWTRRIICKPNSIRVELEFTPIKALPANTKPALNTQIKILAKTAQPFNQPNANPINVLTYSYSFDIHYDPLFSWYKGYHIQDDTIYFSPLHEKTFEIGVTHTFGYEVNF